MEEKRKHPRTEINEPAYVSSGGAIMSCTVRNISVEGAAIDVDNPAFVPPCFRLVMASDSAVHECRIAWIRQKRIGVTFVAMPSRPHNTDGKKEWARFAWSLGTKPPPIPLFHQGTLGRFGHLPWSETPASPAPA